MASSDKELEEELLEAGNRLLEQCPTSVDELLNLLDQVESCLSRVEQSPSKSMQTALFPSRKALVASELMKHSDDDVKVAVASCISEITRITAPDAPYDDDQMKDIFQLIVSSLENLSDKSSRSYYKRTSILETVAKVRSCVVMLDLECDALIIEMLQYFLKAIRDYHPDIVFSSMETIMTLLLEESEDISLELLSPILATVKKDNEEVMPIAQRLGEKVLENCATKIRPYLIQSVKSLDISLDDYSLIVAKICRETSGVVGKNDLNASGEHLVNESKLASGAVSDDAAQVAKEIAAEAASHGEVDHAAGSSPKPVISNGVVQTQDDNALVDSNSIKNPEHSDDIKQSKSDDVPSKTDHDSLGAENNVESEIKPEQTTKRRGKKRKSSTTATEPSIVTPAEPPTVTGSEPSDSSPDIGEKEPEELAVSEKSQSKEVCSASREDPSVEAVMPLDSKVETDTQLSSPKTLESDSANAVSPSPSGSLPDMSHTRKAGRSKKKSLIQEATVSADKVIKKLPEGTIVSEVKAQKRSGKKVPAGIPNDDTAPARVDTSKEDSGTASDPEESPREVGKKVDTSDDNEHESSKKQKKEKMSGKGKASLKRETASLSRFATKSVNGADPLDKTPRTNSKRKRTPGKEIVSDGTELRENLVGKKIKVWWPKDQMFYEGTVDFWDPLKKKHKVLYNDGDEEILFLNKQRWELVEGDSVSDMEQGTAQPSPDASSEIHRKKKGKMNGDSSIKQGKMDASPKSGGEGSSNTNKSKGAATKSGRKSKDDSKKDGKSKVDGSKTAGKSEVGNSGKSKDHTPKGGSSKSMDDISKAAGKSKNVEPDTPKNSKKFEHGTPKTAAKVKGKSPKSGSKSSANGTGKVKSGSSKAKKGEEVEEKPLNSLKTPPNAKRKSPDSSKAQESEARTGKKRRRGGRS